MTDDERKIITRTIGHEGAYNNDPDDAGGETKYGISRAQYPHWDIKNLTQYEAALIYYQDYYAPLHLHLIDSPRVKWKVFDIGVNCGIKTAAKMLQRAIKCEPVDGIIGNGTAFAVNSTKPELVLAGLVEEQKRHYRDIVARKPSQGKYLNGWLNRSEDTGEGL